MQKGQNKSSSVASNKTLHKSYVNSLQTHGLHSSKLTQGVSAYDLTQKSPEVKNRNTRAR